MGRKYKYKYNNIVVHSPHLAYKLQLDPYYLGRKVFPPTVVNLHFLRRKWGGGTSINISNYIVVSMKKVGRKYKYIILTYNTYIVDMHTVTPQI